MKATLPQIARYLLCIRVSDSVDGLMEIKLKWLWVPSFVSEN